MRSLIFVAIVACMAQLARSDELSDSAPSPAAECARDFFVPPNRDWLQERVPDEAVPSAERLFLLQPACDGTFPAVTCSRPKRASSRSAIPRVAG